MEQEKKYFFDHPRNVKLVIYSLYGSCGILMLLDFIVHRHIIHHWEGLLGFYAIYGLVGCIAIGLSSNLSLGLHTRSPYRAITMLKLERTGRANRGQLCPRVMRIRFVEQMRLL